MRITEELLRKRSEHNEGMLSTLEEVALHQFEIERIENLDKLCRHIKILLLQNNIIPKIENVGKLKELEYLNLALNNIQVIENLEGCESLLKLDLTCNFLDIETWEESCNNLAKCPAIKEIYMTGNPIQSFNGWKEILIATVDTLKMVDGTEVLTSERIIAKQKLDDLIIELRTAVEMKKVKESIEPKNTSEGAYTIENRVKMYKEMEEQKLADDKKKNPDKYKEKKISSTHYANGEARQCNEGKYEFKLIEYDDAEFVLFEMKLPKFLDTSLIDVNLFPKLISIRVKDKLTQLKLTEEVLPEKADIKRSQTTGYLHITIPKVNPNELLVSIKRKKEEEARAALKAEREKKLMEKKQKEEEESKKEEKPKNESNKKQPLKVDYSLDDVPDLE